jgi:hypothetical protein
VFGDPYLVWHEGPDFARLTDVARTRPAEVARMLAAGMAAADPVAAQSLAVLGLPESESLLRAAVASATETFLVRVAQALHLLTGDESWAAPIASVLASDAFWGVRIDAAIALAGFAPTAELIETLDAGVRDAEFLVRCHSANALLRYAGRTRQVDAIPTLFAKIADGDAGQAADELSAAATRKLTGS